MNDSLNIRTPELEPVREAKMNQLSIRVEPVDNHHPAWSQVLASILRNGNHEAIMLREDGWLASRQTVLAAFCGEDVIGHLCFRVEPMVMSRTNRAIGSKVDSFSIDGNFEDLDVHESLMQRADSMALLMRCAPPRLQATAC